ncbi:protein TonB [Novosphingobium sp. PhB57]|uniref:energy transducer TonB family protein n=1 Tax=Novosphingobium sp. PhB57 TaxID=2485107 RepID=UPI0010E68BFF|nr:energy transducer TonB [Novosphingobium sp. PhB57]TCU57777.1 protein TonB [Novosphingobium sp. PhB57]
MTTSLAMRRLSVAIPVEGAREPVSPPRVRYSDQPVSLRTRLAGFGGTSAICLAILAGLLLTWRTYTAPPPPANIAAFNVAPPAAPPEPVREVPPGPEQVKREQQKPRPEKLEVEMPKIAIPNTNALSVAPPAKPVPVDPGPPIKETTAPISKPAPPAPQVSSGKPTWQGLVLGALDKVKRYPRDAHFARQQGVPYIRFTMDRQGKVLSVSLERPSGFRSLDREALALPKRAQPLPKPPEDVKGDAIELVVPVEFFMQ